MFEKSKFEIGHPLVAATRLGLFSSSLHTGFVKLTETTVIFSLAKPVC